MKFIASLIFAVLISITAAQAAECDCSSYSGSCSATGKFVGERLNFTSSSLKCSQIQYYVDGEPGSITITGGRGSMNFFKTNKSAKHQLSVDSCSICRGGDAGAEPSKAICDNANNSCNSSCNASTGYEELATRGGPGMGSPARLAELRRLNSAMWQCWATCVAAKGCNEEAARLRRAAP